MKIKSTAVMVGSELSSQIDVQLFMPICNVFFCLDKFVVKISTLLRIFMLKFWYQMKAHFKGASLVQAISWYFLAHLEKFACAFVI